MFKRKAALLTSAVLMLTLSGCSVLHYFENRDADLVAVSYDAADDLQSNLKRKLPKNSLIVVSTLLNVDNLNKTSSFGRIISDQVASAFHNLGYQIIGMEMPIDLFFMKEGGSLQLSPETKTMLKHYQAAFLVGGVYAPGKKNTYVSLRIVDIRTKEVLSSTDFSVPTGSDAKTLLESKEVGSAGERATPAVITPIENTEKTEKTSETNNDNLQ